MDWIHVLARLTLVVGLGLALGSVPAAAQQAPDSGSFVVRLGTDTTAVERYVRTVERLQAWTVTRSPFTRLHELTVELTPDGEPRTYELTTRDVGSDGPGAVVQRVVVRYGPDSITVDRPQGVETRPRPQGSPLLPFSTTFQSLVETAVAGSAREGGGTVHMLAGDGSPMPLEVSRAGADTVALETGALGTWRARVDAAARILWMDAGALNTTVERVAWLDVPELARRYAALDAEGRGMGPLSPRDTVRVRVGGANLVVDYGRPSKRGRGIFGGLVPWNEVWRTGANQATQLSTDRALRIGDATLEPGTYTLFTIPAPEGWTLIVNRQTGQAGTEYDQAQDVTRQVMRVSARDVPEERFTISLVETGSGQGLLEMVWDRVRAWIPLEIPGA